MADETSRERLPIKLIMPKQGTERKVPGGGPPAKPFRAVTAEYRRSLTNQVSAVRGALSPQMKRVGTAPVRVKLLPKAAAKSHRPEHLFSHQSCPIIGSGRLGELFVKATADGLEKLARIIEFNVSVRATPRLTEAAVTTTGCGRPRPWV